MAISYLIVNSMTASGYVALSYMVISYMAINSMNVSYLDISSMAVFSLAISVGILDRRRKQMRYGSPSSPPPLFFSSVAKWVIE